MNTVYPALARWANECRRSRGSTPVVEFRAVPAGLESSLLQFPALKRWAKFVPPSGAGLAEILPTCRTTEAHQTQNYAFGVLGSEQALVCIQLRRVISVE